MSRSQDPSMVTRILCPGAHDPALGAANPALRAGAELIRKGELVVFPTETVYGLGADARNPLAVEKVFSAKGRPSDNPLIVHVHSMDAALACVEHMNPLTRALAEGYWPGPVTLVCNKSSLIADRTSAGLPTVGIRVPGLTLARDFLEACDCPVAAPSANRSGRPSPTTFAMAVEDMDGRVGAIIDGPDADLGLESAILYAPDNKTLHLLRAGSLDPLGILSVLGQAGFSGIALWYQGRRLDLANGPCAAEPQNPGHDSGEPGPADSSLPAAPGTRYRHYSPRARVVLYRNAAELARLLEGEDLRKTGVMGMGEAPVEGVRWSWQARDAAEYSRMLYRSFREADLQDCAVLLAWVPSGHGEYLTALRDRLYRAAGATGN